METASENSDALAAGAASSSKGFAAAFCSPPGATSWSPKGLPPAGWASPGAAAAGSSSSSGGTVSDGPFVPAFSYPAVPSHEQATESIVDRTTTAWADGTRARVP